MKKFLFFLLSTTSRFTINQLHYANQWMERKYERKDHADQKENHRKKDSSKKNSGQEIIA